MKHSHVIKIAESVKESCIEAARESFNDASMRGLCSEGAIEAAVGAMQSIDIDKAISNAGKEEG